uniref:thionin-like protein 2 n=1 Tax=Erigeron canadensis TaxID=72917 RepID=UPI001CB8960A|nr:thionin-like protein 2 [Erigeron canadensis]
MEDKKIMILTMMITMMVVGMKTIVAQNATTPTPIPFTSCYSRCFFFCMIEPQNMCTCTSTCLKKCLDTPAATPMAMDEHTLNLGYCKLGCATSLCSNISQLNNPNVQSMGRCVDSCSNKCTISYYLSP